MVSCLTATHGRYDFLKRAISCFAEQDYEDRELIVLNNHPVPIHTNIPRVRIINENGHPTLGDCRQRLLSEATGVFVRTWDDDDFYLPWAISQGVEYIAKYPDKPIWKPNRSWSWQVEKDIVVPNGNVYEASWTMRKWFVDKCGYKQGSGGDEHYPLREGLRTYGGIMRDEVGPERFSYAYSSGNGLCRISGTLGHERGIQWRTERWMKLNDNHGDEAPIEKMDLTPYYKRIKRAIDELPSERS